MLRAIACPAQEEREWQTVGAPRRGSLGIKADTYTAKSNPLLDDTGFVYRGHSYDEERVPGISYDRDIFRGGYGSMGVGMHSSMDADGGPGFPGRRGLPTRQDDLS